MGEYHDPEAFFEAQKNFLKKIAPNIITETATDFFQTRFTTKEWDGSPWPQTKVSVRRGSLMLRSGKLMKSIKPKEVTPERVVISAGSDQVPYAQPHNEGGEITVPITDKMRRFAWAMYYKEGGKGVRTSKSGAQYQSISVGQKANPWKGLALTKKTALTIKLPKRQFMGNSRLLNQQVETRIAAEYKRLF